MSQIKANVYSKLGKTPNAYMDPSKAEADYHYLLTKAHNFLSAEQESDTHFYLSQTYIEQGQLERALQHLRMSLEIEEQVSGPDSERSQARFDVLSDIQLLQRRAL